MSKDLNKVQLIGRLGQDPELRATGAGQSVVNCTLATSDQWTGKDGTKQEATTWHRCVIWSKLGEIAAQYCKKGDKLYIEGSISHRDYQDNEGVTKHISEIKVRDLIMLGSKGESRSEGQPERPSGNSKPAPDGNTVGGGSDGFTDDIPFRQVDGRYV